MNIFEGVPSTVESELEEKIDKVLLIYRHTLATEISMFDKTFQ